MSWWLPVGQHMHLWSVYSLVLSSESSPDAPAYTHTHLLLNRKHPHEQGVLDFPLLLLLWDWWRWEASGIRLSPDYFFSFSSFNATELRSLLLLVLLHCSRWLLHQKRKESFDLDMPFFSVPLYNFCRKTKTWLSASLVSVLSGKNSCFYQMSSQNL